MADVHPSPEVLVLGGGLSGLMAAWQLRQLGYSVRVWEASPAAGGWAQTLPWPGPEGEPGWLERGPQALQIQPGSALERLGQALGLAYLPRGPKGPRWIGRGGRRHPSGPLRFPGLRLGERLRLLGEPFVPARPPEKSAEETLAAFMARRLGPGFAREALPALVAGVLAAPPERLGLDALPQLRELESRGGLLLGGLRQPPQRSRQVAGGTGALAQALRTALGAVETGRAAQRLEARAGGGWRAWDGTAAMEVPSVVLALPAPQAAGLLRDLAPRAASLLAGIPQLDLRVWHSRHPPVPHWRHGFTLLLHPPEGRGLLGVVALAAEDPRGVPGLLQLRTYLGGAYPVAPDLEGWPGLWSDQHRWLPELRDPVQVRCEDSPGAFPLLGPGHADRVASILEALPPGLHWLGASRFGPGIPNLAEGIERWASAGLPAEVQRIGAAGPTRNGRTA